MRDGWLDTGDLGRVDAGGFVYLTGRAKDLIIRGGHNIDPRVIEDALLAHPAVRAAVAVGRPDRHSGEVPVAYVVPAGPGAFDEAQLLAWAGTAIDEPAARPKRIYPMTELPVTAVGKPFKPALIADAAVRAITDALSAGRPPRCPGHRGLRRRTTRRDRDRRGPRPRARRCCRIRPHRPPRAVAGPRDRHEVTPQRGTIMNDYHNPATGHPVIIVGAPAGLHRGPAARRLRHSRHPAQRYPQPHPLPRAVHLDDEVLRTLSRIGVSEGFLARSRSCSGLRLLDAEHRVMAEFHREHQIGANGFPQANMFHQPDLEALMLARVEKHPLIDLRRDAEVCGMEGTSGTVCSGVVGAGTADPVRVHARVGEDLQTFTGTAVLGCDGANSTIRQLAGITMEDLGFTERWLVIDIRVEDGLEVWDGVEQICDPARAATFMQVTGDRYRWEFRLLDGEDEASLITPAALGRLLRPWTGRDDLDGMEIIRSACYTFRARLASRFRADRVFLLGDAAHLTPPFIGQGLAAGLRDADNLAWKLAYVLTGRAGEELLTSYDTERRPHAKALIDKAVRVGWAMTGGQDRAAAIRRIVLAAAVRSDRVSAFMGSTATPG